MLRPFHFFIKNGLFTDHVLKNRFHLYKLELKENVKTRSEVERLGLSHQEMTKLHIPLPELIFIS